jgi:hypothetical protein
MPIAIEVPRRLSKREVERAVSDWKRRLEALYTQIEEWAVAEWGDGCVERGTKPQMGEYMLEQAGVRPRVLPTLTLRVGARTIRFLPDCLWNIGANGEVIVLAGDRSYSVYDLGGENGLPSDWQAVSYRLVHVPFTREILRKMAAAKQV